jgi:hypothetical protein
MDNQHTHAQPELFSPVLESTPIPGTNRRTVTLKVENIPSPLADTLYHVLTQALMFVAELLGGHGSLYRKPWRTMGRWWQSARQQSEAEIQAYQQKNS